MIYARTGMKGHNVQSWQIALNKTRAKFGNPFLVEDGIFGSKTAKATINLQRGLGLKADGIVGDQTKTAFKKAYPMVSLSFITSKSDMKPETKRELDKQALEEGKSNRAKATTRKIFPRTTPKPRPSSNPPPIPEKKSSPVIPLALVSAIGYFMMKP